ncbi:hypothetical protein CLV30_12634 [Haloactinopolyspora alba]|uniref:Uncharacterized protein n=1 Tax=Haloactinopolyspora alba TaxID=648780 RepID=A0A2P8DGN2_9ACTN|nr:hypothetical protein [Haloactinopolyspora alba]PSK96375.1 hypothetical protein CLV30_12634 [Haloactinopolyspora alba]
MRHYSRRTRQRSLLARLRGIRAYTEIVGMIFRDLRPLIVVLVVGAGLIFDADALRHLVALLVK